MRYIIAPSIFYRLYGDKTLVYNTLKRKVYLFNETTYEILNCFFEASERSVVIEKLKKKYDCESVPDFEKGISSFIEQLLKLGILNEEFKHREIFESLEGALNNGILPKDTLDTAMLELTFRCNERCRHCYVVNKDKDELTTAEVFKVLDELAEMNVLSVTFTGGEVFLRRDFIEILEYAYKKRFLINIFTNGNLITDTDLIKIAGVYPKSLSFSVYSHIPEKHDYITQIKGSFEKTISVIKKAVTIGLSVNIKSTIMEYTKNDVAGILDLAESLSVTAQIGITVNAKDDGDLEPLTLRIKDEEDYRKVLKTAMDKVEFCQGIAGDLATDTDDYLCGAGHRTISIAPNGNVYPCNALRLNLGSIREKSLMEIWTNSSTLLEWRKATINNLKECQSCELLKSMGVCSFCAGAALQETGSPFKKYDEACTITKVRNLL